MFDKIALTIIILGALNWGSIGLFNFDVIGYIFGGANTTLSRIIFGIVGLAGIWCISFLFRERSVTNDL